jgi:hypothetical protein
MTTFKEYLQESYKNLFKANEKEDYAEQVYALLIKSYSSIGGLKGNGFTSAEDMIENIPFWKVKTLKGEVIAAALYKDKSGRKMVAICSDGSHEGKKAVLDMMTNDLKRAYTELSSSALKFLIKKLGINEVEKYLIPLEKVKELVGEIHDVPEDDKEVKRFPELKDYFYQRNLGGHLSTKIAFGKPNLKIEKKI